MLKPKIIFFGASDFAFPHLKNLIADKYRILAVITNFDKPAGRKQVVNVSPIKNICEKFNIPVLQPEKAKESYEKIKELNPDLIIVASYGKLLPEEIINIPKHGSLNVHPSLLPKWRGPSPIQYTILNGDQETGVTIILMDDKMDHGDILAQSIIKVPGARITHKELEQVLAEAGSQLLLETVPKWMKKEINPMSQKESEATFCKYLTRDDGKIDWNTPAQEIEKKIRAFDPWPGCFCYWEKTKGAILRMKIIKARIYDFPDKSLYPIGKTLVAPQNELCVQTSNGYLIIERLQVEGGKSMFSEDFIRGNNDFMGTVLK